jgi:hypothetical protein
MALGWLQEPNKIKSANQQRIHCIEGTSTVGAVGMGAVAGTDRDDDALSADMAEALLISAMFARILVGWQT